MAQILFVHNKPTPFVVCDRDLLLERWPVQDWYQADRWVRLPELFQSVQSCDLVVGWFASWHTFWPAVVARLLRKPYLLIVGGYDTARVSEIGYGHQRGGVKGWLSSWIMRGATRVVTHSFDSFEEIGRNIGKDVQAKTDVIYLGLPRTDVPIILDRREPMALTVGNVDRSNLRRKGHYPFVQAAALLSDVRFVLAGAWQDDAISVLRAVATPNVNFTNWIEPQALAVLFQQASVYVQASLHEGFGLAVAEAMAAGCIPVVTRVGSLPEVVDDCGVYVEPEPQAIADGIQIALESSPDQRRRARDRILNQFPVSKRRAALWACVEQVMTHDRETNPA